MNLVDLDERTRELMKDEVTRAQAADNLYLSHLLTSEGQKRYVDLFVEAIRSGNPRSFADSLRPHFGSHYHTRSGKLHKTPRNAAERLGNGEFNLYYVRAMCVRAMEEGRRIEVYRARRVSTPRPKSEALIGSSPDAAELLSDLESGDSFENALGIPGGPNSGISVRFVEDSDGE